MTGKDINADYLAYRICQFFHNYDPYEFADNYNTIQEAHEDLKNSLYSYSNTNDYLYNMKEIANDLKDDNDSQIVSLYMDAKDIINYLEEYKKTFNKNMEL